MLLSIVIVLGSVVGAQGVRGIAEGIFFCACASFRAWCRAHSEVAGGGGIDNGHSPHHRIERKLNHPASSKTKLNHPTASSKLNQESALKYGWYLITSLTLTGYLIHISPHPAPLRVFQFFFDSFRPSGAHGSTNPYAQISSINRLRKQQPPRKQLREARRPEPSDGVPPGDGAESRRAAPLVPALRDVVERAGEEVGVDLEGRGCELVSERKAWVGESGEGVSRGERGKWGRKRNRRRVGCGWDADADGMGMRIGGKGRRRKRKETHSGINKPNRLLAYCNARVVHHREDRADDGRRGGRAETRARIYRSRRRRSSL